MNHKDKKEKLIEDLKDIIKDIEKYEKLYFGDLTINQRLGLLSSKNYLYSILDSES